MNQDTVVGVIVFVLIAGGALYWVRVQFKRKRARAWPSTMGQVESTAIRLDGDQSRHIAEVVYSYSAQGQNHSGHLRRNFALHGRAQKWIGGYEKGRALNIRYNPENSIDSELFEDEQAGMQVS
jgi:hypothetical protein